MITFHIMHVALITFGVGMMVMGLRWYKCYTLGINFPRFPKLLFIFGIFAFITSILFFTNVSRSILHYIFSLCGAIYLLSVLWIQRKEIQ